MTVGAEIWRFDSLAQVGHSAPLSALNFWTNSKM
jgi:hypothetical protein